MAPGWAGGALSLFADPQTLSSHSLSVRLPTLWRREGECWVEVQLRLGIHCTPWAHGPLQASLAPASRGPSWLLLLSLKLQQESPSGSGSCFLPLLRASQGPQALQCPQAAGQLLCGTLPYLPPLEATPGAGGT